MANSLVSMVDYLKFWGRIETSEGFEDPADLERIITQASQQHNANYACTTAKFTVPDAEVPVVNLLSLVLLCQVRATKMSMAPTMRTGDFQTTRDTPFEKTMKLMAEYLKQYKEQCQVLGLSVFFGSNNVLVVEMASESMETGAMTPYEIAQDPPVINLETPSAPVDGSLILTFSTPIFGQFSCRYVFHSTGLEPIYQPWNTASTVLSRINNGAELLTKTNNQRAVQFKVVDLDVTPGTVHRFLVVTLNRSGFYSYSNEVTVTVSA